MKRILLILVYLFLFKSFTHAQDIYDSIQVGNVWRTYNIHLPGGYNPANAYPLVLGFHGGQQPATSAQGWTIFAYQSKLSEKADSNGFIVVYPEGRVINQNRTWNAGNCCPPAANVNEDDVGFIDALLDTLLLTYSIDSTRVYATGSSNGGMLCYRLACELSGRFAAIAPNACSQMYFPCNPTNPVSVISFHSLIDPIVAYTGGNGGAPPLTNTFFPSQDSVLNTWSILNTCQNRDTIVNGNGNGYNFIRVHNCLCNVELHHYATSDGSHSWPGGNPNNNPVSTQIVATDLLWDFFQNNTSACLPTSNQHSIKPPAIPQAYPNPFENRIRISGINEAEQLVLLDCCGRVIWTGTNIELVDFSNLASGMYAVKSAAASMKIFKR